MSLVGHFRQFKGAGMSPNHPRTNPLTRQRSRRNQRLNQKHEVVALHHDDVQEADDDKIIVVGLRQAN
jgi:hypothetical protein